MFIWILTVKCIYYLCVWRRPQIFIKKKKRMALLTNSILHIMWKETKNKLHSVVMKRRADERKTERKEGRKELKQWLGSCCILWVQRKPRLWLQSDVEMSWRGLSFMYVQLSFETSTFSAHKHTQTHH